MVGSNCPSRVQTLDIHQCDEEVSLYEARVLGLCNQQDQHPRCTDGQEYERRQLTWQLGKCSTVDQSEQLVTQTDKIMVHSPAT